MRHRKIIKEEHIHHDRWLVSYADFITLLFAFFVVMYASSSVNQYKYNAVSSSISSAFKTVQFDSLTETEKKFKNGTEVDDHQKKKEDQTLVLIDPIAIAKIKHDKLLSSRERMIRTKSDLVRKLKPLIDQGKITVTQVPRGIRIDIQDSYLFTPGSAKIANSAAVSTLEEIAPILANSDRPIEIEGHTDNQPIKNREFQSNWDLSALRATSVLRILSDEGLAENRLSATGYGSSRPAATNETPEGKAKNRRVSIFVIQEGSQRDNASN